MALILAMACVLKLFLWGAAAGHFFAGKIVFIKMRKAEVRSAVFWGSQKRAPWAPWAPQPPPPPLLLYSRWIAQPAFFLDHIAIPTRETHYLPPF